MIQNLLQIRDRLSAYTPVPIARFATDSGNSPQEESVKQKVRQYWADERISNAQRLRGFDLDISGFDPKNTTNREIRQIAGVLADMGNVDHDTAGWLGGIDLEFDAQGKEINLDKPVDAYAYFDSQLKALNKYIDEGNEFAKHTLVKLKTSITVMMALEERANQNSRMSLVSVRV